AQVLSLAPLHCVRVQDSGNPGYEAPMLQWAAGDFRPGRQLRTTRAAKANETRRVGLERHQDRLAVAARSTIRALKAAPASCELYGYVAITARICLADTAS